MRGHPRPGLDFPHDPTGAFSFPLFQLNEEDAEDLQEGRTASLGPRVTAWMRVAEESHLTRNSTLY